MNMNTDLPRPKDKLASLVTDYPELFQNMSAMTAHTAKRRNLVDGELFFYFQCCDGWYDILQMVCHRIKHRLGRYREVVEIRDRLMGEGRDLEKDFDWIIKFFEKNTEDPLDTFSIDQIKEKFGGLRFYYSGPKGEDWTYIQGVISMAEGMSYKTCETCGAPGHSVKAGWLQTLCSSCEATEAAWREERNKKLEERETRSKQNTQRHSREGLSDEL